MIGRVLPVPRRLDLVVLGCALSLSVLGCQGSLSGPTDDDSPVGSGGAASIEAGRVRQVITDSRADERCHNLYESYKEEAIRSLDKAVTKGVIHRNTAARKKSALARRLVAAK